MRKEASGRNVTKILPFRPDTFVDEDPLAWKIKKEGMLIEHIF